MNSLTNIAALVLAVVVFQARPAMADPVVGKPAPRLVVHTLDDQTLDLATLRGRVVVLNVWATWCAPCREEMPALDAFYHAYAPRGVDVIGLSADRPRDLGAVQRVMSAFGYPAALLATAPANGLGVQAALPLTVVVGPDGLVRAIVSGDSGPLTQQRLAALVEPLLPRTAHRP